MGVEMPTTEGRRRGRVSGPTSTALYRPRPLVSEGRSEPSNNKVLRLEGPEVLQGAHQPLPLRFRNRRCGVPAAVLRARSVGWRRADTVIAPRADGRQALPPSPEVYPQWRAMGEAGLSVSSAFPAPSHHRGLRLRLSRSPALFPSAC